MFSKIKYYKLIFSLFLMRKIKETFSQKFDGINPTILNDIKNNFTSMKDDDKIKLLNYLFANSSGTNDILKLDLLNKLTNTFNNKNYGIFVNNNLSILYKKSNNTISNYTDGNKQNIDINNLLPNNNKTNIILIDNKTNVSKSSQKSINNNNNNNNMCAKPPRCVPCSNLKNTNCRKCSLPCNYIPFYFIILILGSCVGFLIYNIFDLRKMLVKPLVTSLNLEQTDESTGDNDNDNNDNDNNDNENNDNENNDNKKIKKTI